MNKRAGNTEKSGLIKGAEFFKQLRILHFALVTGLILIAAILYFTSGHDIAFAKQENKSLILMIAGLLIASFFGGNYVFRSMMRTINYERDLIHKMDKARKAYISKLAFFEFAGIISIFLFFVKADLAFLAYGSIMIIYMTINSPSKKILFSSMQLSNEEIRKIEDEHEPVSSNNKGL